MISVLIVCRKIDSLLLRTVKSIVELKPQIIIDLSEKNKPLGVRKNRLISQAAYEWILVLDTDEVVSRSLLGEIKNVVVNDPDNINGFKISYQSYFYDKPLYYGGEKYSRIQFFRKNFGKYTPASVHEHSIISGRIDKLYGVINHYTYNNVFNILTKFTKYAWQMAGEKRKENEAVTVKKLLLYGPHMIWARAIKDEGWRDGWQGIVLALCFGYMETLIYWFLLWRKLFR